MNQFVAEFLQLLPEIRRLRDQYIDSKPESDAAEDSVLNEDSDSEEEDEVQQSEPRSKDQIPFGTWEAPKKSSPAKYYQAHVYKKLLDFQTRKRAFCRVVRVGMVWATNAAGAERVISRTNYVKTKLRAELADDSLNALLSSHFNGIAARFLNAFGVAAEL